MNKLNELRQTAREILGVDFFSTQEQIHAAYRKKAQKFHPDKTGKEQTMKLINQAYEILTNPDFNNEYHLLQDFESMISRTIEEKIKTPEEYNEWHKRQFYGHGVI